MDCSPPGCYVDGIFQARKLEWVAIPFSRGSSQLRDQIQVSCIAGGFFTIWTNKKAPVTWPGLDFKERMNLNSILFFIPLLPKMLSLPSGSGTLSQARRWWWTECAEKTNSTLIWCWAERAPSSKKKLSCLTMGISENAHSQKDHSRPRAKHKPHTVSLKNVWRCWVVTWKISRERFHGLSCKDRMEVPKTVV